jgi:hypothetical protein
LMAPNTRSRLADPHLPHPCLGQAVQADPRPTAMVRQDRTPTDTTPTHGSFCTGAANLIKADVADTAVVTAHHAPTATADATAFVTGVHSAPRVLACAHVTRAGPGAATGPTLVPHQAASHSFASPVGDGSLRCRVRVRLVGRLRLRDRMTAAGGRT